LVRSTLITGIAVPHDAQSDVLAEPLLRRHDVRGAVAVHVGDPYSIELRAVLTRDVDGITLGRPRLRRVPSQIEDAQPLIRRVLARYY
jgi:hypothetical protein